MNEQYDNLTINLYVTEATPIPTASTPTVDSLIKVYTSSELEPQPYNVLSDNYTYYAYVDFYDPAGNIVKSLFKEIHESYESGVITFTNDTVADILSKLGPGVSAMRVQVLETPYYKASPVMTIPIEVRPPNWIKFGEKNSKIDLINPFINGYSDRSTAFDGEEEMPFESNYPHLMGTVWVEPDFLGTSDDKERSIGDYIGINFMCEAENEDGSVSVFPLRGEVMLRPGNRDGILAFDLSLGPEDLFLMGLTCSINVTFDIAFNEEAIYEDDRQVEILLLDLRLEENPSSNAPSTIWSIYSNHFDSTGLGFTLSKEENSISYQTGTVSLGGVENGVNYGVEIEYYYEPETNSYKVDEDHDLLNLAKLESIEALEVIGLLDGEEITLTKNIDWQEGSELTEIEFLTENSLDNYSTFTVIYKFTFDFGSNYYGKITLGPDPSEYNLNSSIIRFDFPEGFIPDSDDCKSFMFVRYNQTFDGAGAQDFVLNYGIQDAASWSDKLFKIYNDKELESKFGTFTTSVENEHPKLHFDAPVTGLFDVVYGVRSQYELDYGFQKDGKSYSDSIRLIYNNEDIENKPIIGELPTSTAIATRDVSTPSLYIGLDNSSEETTLKLYDLPLLYAPEVNLTFVLDPLTVDQVKSHGTSEVNALEIKFYYATSVGYGSYYFDSIAIPLNHTTMLPSLEIDGSYLIHYSKDLQSIYDYIGTSSFDMYITISQTGNNSNYISYVLLDNFEYICDEHLIEMYDRKPLDYYGNFDVGAALNTPHYVQLFSKPFIDGQYGESPFYLLDNSEITVGIDGLPNSTLVSLDKNGDGYFFNYLGTSETLLVSDSNMYMIPNLGLFTDAYDLEEPLYQDGWVDLFYGSGTDMFGEQFINKKIPMDYKNGVVEDYSSVISAGVPTSWEYNFSLTDQFLTTQEIVVSGEVLYHQLFDLTSDNDVLNVTEITEILGTIPGAYFGFKIPDQISLTTIREIGTPYAYDLSVQGFPMGDYVDGTYCNVKTSGTSSNFDPRSASSKLNPDIYYSLEISSSGLQYIIFYETIANVSGFADNNKIMVDYWADHYFVEGFDYDIVENPNQPYESLLVWDFKIESLTSYTMHPDFAIDNSFSAQFYALDWSQIDNDYVLDAVDEFTFQPEVQTNVTVYYGSGSTMTFSVLGTVADNQFNRTGLFTNLYIYIWKDNNESTIELHKLEDPIGNNYISQDAELSYHFIIDFNTIENDLPVGFVVLEESFVFPEVKFDSNLLYYSLEHTPFNYDYVSTVFEDYHIKITIDGNTVIFSNETAEFNKYVNKIEDNLIYFNYLNFTEDGYIANNTEIKVEYKYKLQPGLLDSKHFLLVTLPWTNVFEPMVEEDTSVINRNKYRKISGSSIISPFEYSLSINDTYLLLLSYRLNQREYYEEEFTIDYSLNKLEFDFMPYNVDDYMSVFEDDFGPALNIYYYDVYGKMQFLDDSHFSYDLQDHTVTIKRDGNQLATPNEISEFFVSFTPVPNDKQFKSYQYSYNPEGNIEDTLALDYWEVINGERLDVIPNLDAYHFIDEEESDYYNYICRATQIAAFLEDGQKLSFDIGGELTWFDQDLINGIRNGDYVDLYVNTMIENYDALEAIKIELFNSTSAISGLTQTISIEDLVIWNFNLKINLPAYSSNDLQRIEFTPIFRQDAQYSEDNVIGVPQFEFLEWDDQMTVIDAEGNLVMVHELENELFIEESSLEIAYLFNTKLQYLALPEDVSFNWSVKEDIYGNNVFELKIPNTYINPENPAVNYTFKNGDVIVLRYNSPVEKKFAIAIEEMYFNKKPTGFDSLPIFTEFLLINSTDEANYDEFLTPYNVNASLQLTPFDTEKTQSYKNIAIELNLSTIESFATEGYIDFSHIMFSVPYPTHELTIDQIVIIEQSQELADYVEYFDNQVWQYTEVELFTSGEDPSTDQYQLALDEEPIFYNDPDQGKWLEYLRVYDKNNTYYSVGISGDEHQLHWSPATNNITWNPSFDIFQEFWGIEEYLTPMIAPNSTLYFEYCTEESWTRPISIDYENVEYSSLEVVYEYDYLLTPRYDDWYGEIREENDYDYELIQYYSESFTVYDDSSEYTHTFDIDYDFNDDFINLSIYKIVGLYANFTEKYIKNDLVNYSVNFDRLSEQITITDLIPDDGTLNCFDLITIILNFTAGPISTSSQIVLSQHFNSSFLEDMEGTFYDSLSISFDHSAQSAIYLFDERSDDITSDLTSFTSINYTRNTYLSDNKELAGFGDTVLFEEFIVFYDPYNVVYEADPNMDGVTDYKHEIDVDQDGIVDITRFGVEVQDENNPDNVLWHTIVQDFEGEESFYRSQVGETHKTEWFNVKDGDFNYGSLLKVLGADSVDGATIAGFLQPDRDYWGQKSVSQSQKSYGATETKYYSVLTDNDKDGEPDVQMSIQKTKTIVYNEIKSAETAIIAAKPLDLIGALCEYIEDSWNAIWSNIKREDSVFNRKLTEERLESGNYSSLSKITPEIAIMLNSTYKKFTKVTIKSFKDVEIEEQITINEWEDGELIETRIYQDKFNSEFFDSTELMAVINEETGQETELPIGYSPSFLNTSRERWARDGVSEKFDQLYVVSADQEVEAINLHQDTITITIPSRFSPYHDHRETSQEDAVKDTSFEVTGVLVTPADKQVYYTSDKDAFKSGDAKTTGHYFYFDSDLDNYYETVYVLAPDYDNDGNYNVLTIAYISGNENNFAPYEKIEVDEPISNRNDYSQLLSSETTQSGVNWVASFALLRGEEDLFKKETYDGLEPKADFFEIWKLVKKSEKATKFSQLFYEVRHKEYDRVWNEYSKNFWRDVTDQVIATLAASAVSLAIIASSWGFATPIAHVAFVVVYAAISKLQMDIKAKEAEALRRSQTFYPEGSERREPISINQKHPTDEFWGDSMPAALSGHAGAYYATIMGGEVGSQYTAQAIVSPPSDARFKNPDNVRGILDYMGNMVGTFGSGNPDLFTALDFDNHNLDFLLVSNELYSYNDEEHFAYIEDPDLIEALLSTPEYALDQISSRDSYLFRQNTLAYLTKEIRQATNGTLNTIEATCVDGEPRYVFTTGEGVVPKSTLFQPLIVSPDRYYELKRRGLVDGYIAVDVQSQTATQKQGIDSNQLTNEERKWYSAKIPLADKFGGFDYPIKSVKVYGMKDGRVIDSHLLKSSEYSLDLGNLYLTKSLEELTFSPIGFDTCLDNQRIQPASKPDYFKFVIHIAKIIPDDGSKEMARDALGIATTYAVMDYFDQYTYAQTSAQMIAEVGYTEMMTITSTLISAPVVALGSYAVSAYKQAQLTATVAVTTAATTGASQVATKAATQFALRSLILEIGKRAIIGTIKETVEEIVIDGFFETAIQSAVRTFGWADDAGHWLSTLFTSTRESINFGYLIGSRGSSAQGFTGQVQTAMEMNTEFQSVVSKMMALNEEMSLDQIATANEQFLTAKMAENGLLGKTMQNAKISLGRLLATGLLTGLSLLTPSLAGFNIYAISKLIGSLGGKFSAKLQNRRLAARNAMMLLKDAIEVDKQKEEMGNKPITVESNLPKDKPIVSTMPSIYSSPIESAISAYGRYNLMFQPQAMSSYRGYDDNGVRIREEQENVKDNKNKLEEMKNTQEERDKNIVERQKEKKQQIFDKVELFGFDPQDLDLKYPLTDDDNIQSILFKTLLNLIYKNKATLEEIYNSDNQDFGLTFNPSGTFRTPHGSPDLISAHNLAVILGGMSIKTIKTMLGTIDTNSQGLTFTVDHRLKIRKIRDSTEQIFDDVLLKDAQSIVRSLLNNYIKIRYTGAESFVTQFLAYIDDYTDFGILTESQMSEKLTMGKNYLWNFLSNPRSRKISKYFNLIVNIYISGEFNLGFTDSSKFSDFKEKVTSLAYKILSEDLKIIKKTHTSEKRFEAICLTLTALTNLRYHMPSIFPPIVHSDANPKNYYTLTELSTEISPKNYYNLLNEQLQSGAPSHQLYNIIDVLKIGISRFMDGCSYAKYRIEKYLESKQWSTSEFGNIVHPIYERLLIEYLESKGIKVAHEKFISLLRGTKPDNTIERKSNAERRSGIKSNFEKYIEAFQDILTIPDAINLISVDYTYSSDWKFIKGKLDKDYQSEDRLLIIVLLGQKNDRDVRDINNKLQQEISESDGSKHLENIRIITSEQYGEFFGFDFKSKIILNQFEERFKQYQDLSFNLFHDIDKLFGAITENKRAVSWLEGHHAYEDWMKIYCPQRGQR